MDAVTERTPAITTLESKLAAPQSPISKTALSLHGTTAGVQMVPDSQQDETSACCSSTALVPNDDQPWTNRCLVPSHYASPKRSHADNASHHSSQQTRVSPTRHTVAVPESALGSGTDGGGGPSLTCTQTGSRPSAPSAAQSVDNSVPIPPASVTVDETNVTTVPTLSEQPEQTRSMKDFSEAETTSPPALCSQGNTTPDQPALLVESFDKVLLDGETIALPSAAELANVASNPKPHSPAAAPPRPQAQQPDELSDYLFDDIPDDDLALLECELSPHPSLPAVVDLTSKSTPPTIPSTPQQAPRKSIIVSPKVPKMPASAVMANAADPLADFLRLRGRVDKAKSSSPNPSRRSTNSHTPLAERLTSNAAAAAATAAAAAIPQWKPSARSATQQPPQSQAASVAPTPPASTSSPTPVYRELQRSAQFISAIDNFATTLPEFVAASPSPAPLLSQELQQVFTRATSQSQQSTHHELGQQPTQQSTQQSLRLPSSSVLTHSYNHLLLATPTLGIRRTLLSHLAENRIVMYTRDMRLTCPTEEQSPADLMSTELLVVDERNCILLLQAKALLHSNRSQEVERKRLTRCLMQLSLRYETCWLLVECYDPYQQPIARGRLNPNALEESELFTDDALSRLCGLFTACTGISSAATRHAFTTYLRLCGTQASAAGTILTICDHCRDSSPAWEPSQWRSRETWLSPDVTAHEAFLTAFPCVNPFVAQSILAAMPLSELVSSDLPMLFSRLPWVPQAVLQNLVYLLAGQPPEEVPPTPPAPSPLAHRPYQPATPQHAQSYQPVDFQASSVPRVPMAASHWASAQFTGASSEGLSVPSYGSVQAEMAHPAQEDDPREQSLNALRNSRTLGYARSNRGSQSQLVWKPRG